MKVLHQTSDRIIPKQLSVLQSMQSHFIQTPFGEGEGSWNVHPKCRAVDPFVLTSQGLIRLSSVDASFQREIASVQTWCKKGYGVRLVNVERSLFTS